MGRGLSLIHIWVEIRGSHAKVDLSAAYRSLSGIDLTLADYCVTLTLTQISAIRSVSIPVAELLAPDQDGDGADGGDLGLSLIHI